MPETPARHNLSQVLYALRQSFPEAIASQADRAVPLLQADRQTIQIHPDAVVAVDLQDLDALIGGTKQHAHTDLASCDDCLRRAYERVVLVAGKIQDDDLRRSYLENVPDNREILKEAQERGWCS